MIIDLRIKDITSKRIKILITKKQLKALIEVSFLGPLIEKGVGAKEYRDEEYFRLLGSEPICSSLDEYREFLMSATDRDRDVFISFVRHRLLDRFNESIAIPCENEIKSLLICLNFDFALYDFVDYNESL